MDCFKDNKAIVMPEGDVCISSQTTYTIWNWLLVLDTLSQWAVLLLPYEWEYGYVTTPAALALGTMFSVFFLVGILIADPDNGRFEFNMWGFNIAYFLLTLITVIADVIIRYQFPETYCTPAFNNPNSCDRTWEQLNIFWGVYAFFAIVWFLVIRKMSIHVFKKAGGSIIGDGIAKFS